MANMKGASPQGNYYDAVGLYNDCLAFLPEVEAVVAKLEASLLELVQVKRPYVLTVGRGWYGGL